MRAEAEITAYFPTRFLSSIKFVTDDAGAQQGSVAIIRLSGPDAVQIASSVFVPSSSKKAWMPKTHRVYHGHVLDTEGGVVDEVTTGTCICAAYLSKCTQSLLVTLCGHTPYNHTQMAPTIPHCLYRTSPRMLHAVRVPSNPNSLSDCAQILIALSWRFMQVLLLSMLAPKSYTSEDVIELHCHGGGVCVQRVLGCCLREGARLAKPGEFTLRAFLNGRLDLSQVLLRLLDSRRSSSALHVSM